MFSHIYYLHAIPLHATLVVSQILKSHCGRRGHWQSLQYRKL